MKTRFGVVILIILIIATTIAIEKSNNKGKEYNKKKSDLSMEIAELQEKEKKYENLIERKNELVSNTKDEILKSKKGSTLTNLEEEKTKLVNEIREE